MTPFPRNAYRELVPYVPDRRSVPVDLSDNTNLWGPHPAAARVLAEADGADLTRYPSGYGEELKEAVARRYDIPLEAIATDCGSDDLLDSAFRASCDPGDRVTFPAPTFGMVPLLARMNALEAHPIPSPNADNASEGTPASFLPPPEALLEPGPSAIYVCSPNNPTGEVASREWLLTLLDAAGGPGGPVLVVDEAYAEFHDFSLLRQAPSSPRVVVTRTLSKAYGLAGLRVGYAVGDPELIHEIEKSRGPYKVGRIPEKAAAAAVADSGDWLTGIVSDVQRNRDRLRVELEERGFRPLPSGANFLFVPVGPSPEAGASPATESPPARLAISLRKQGVAVRPFADLPGVGGGLRITVGPWEAMDRLLEGLDTALQDGR